MLLKDTLNVALVIHLMINHTGPAELLWKWGGWLVTQSGGAENTFFSVALYNFQKSGGAEAPPAPPPPRAVS